MDVTDKHKCQKKFSQRAEILHGAWAHGEDGPFTLENFLTNWSLGSIRPQKALWPRGNMVKK